MLITIPILLLGWWIWQSIWGFGGIYTHLRYVPTPNNLLSDNATTVFDFDSGHHYWRKYSVPMTLAELAQFHAERMPKAGWTIERAGNIILTTGEPVYCLVAQQRHITAYISARQSTEPPTQSWVTISLDKSEPIYCDFDTMQ
jgi:hypothetical protein